MSEDNEPNIRYVTVRESLTKFGYTELQLECRFDDEQKFAAVIVDGEFPKLAHRICDFLNAEAGIKSP